MTESRTRKHVAIIGAGFGGLSAAAYLAKQGHQVTIFEKNSMAGGRAMVSSAKGFTFDLGPSWYMMPDVFEDFFAHFGKKPSDFYSLEQLDPSYRVFDQTSVLDVPAMPGVIELFDSLDKGSGEQLGKLLQKTARDYKRVRAGLLDLDGTSVRQALNPEALRMLANPELLQSYHSRISKYISSPQLQHILEFMTVFMGGSPKNIPALYSLLAYVDMGLGIWYPQGGFGAVVDAFVSVAKSVNVNIIYDSAVQSIVTKDGRAVGLVVNGETIACDVVLANADYHHVETTLLEDNDRSYKENYWRKRTLSPSGLLAYIGVDKKIPNLAHHNLLLDVDWDNHFAEVFDKKQWSKRPLVYVSCPSKSDTHVAPKGKENLFILAPMANGLHPTSQQQEQVIKSIIERLEKLTTTQFSKDIVYKDIRAHQYFEDTFNAYEGNAFGLAHTLRQSGPLRPRMRSKKVENLYFVGQYTNPGTGVPMVVISGKVAANLIEQNW